MIKKIKVGLFIFAMLLMQINVQAAESPVYKQTVNKPMDEVYSAVYAALEDARFYVVFEPYISKNISRFAEKWGDDYNQSKLDGIRSMVFCNGWFANKVSNHDPDMLGLCPLSLSMYEKSGKTAILFARPTVMGQQSKALPVLQEIENAVIEAIKTGVKKAG
ncbi:hypothetical protein MNBD_GAMMA08-333 [hydrothermal vent metagenome]|uniref:DUF302 domain-containing protein n=1 Tax=hydrothermal vent metagenome TaxID=652676 RepID=A0A3B0YG07_9ZZZZ